MTTTPKHSWTMSEAARTLQVNQHRLIYLCEEGVVAPDLGDAQGRGSSRKFSRRNMLEFAIALQLDKLEIPVAAMAAIVLVMREFEKHLATKLQKFSLPDGLLVPGSPELRVILSDGRVLYFGLRDGTGDIKVFGGVDVLPLLATHVAPPLFNRANLRRLVDLVSTIEAAKDALSEYLRKRISPDTRQAMLVKGLAGRSQTSLVDELNANILRDPHLFDRIRLAHVRMADDTRRLIEANYSGDRVVLINRMLLHLAYPRELGRSRSIREWRTALTAGPSEPQKIRQVALKSASPNGFGPEGSKFVRAEINVTNIARDLLASR